MRPTAAIGLGRARPTPDEPRMLAAGLVERDDRRARASLWAGDRMAHWCFRCRIAIGRMRARCLLRPRARCGRWTVQRFRPKSPPYVAAEGALCSLFVGYVEFPEGIIIEGRILCARRSR